MKRIINWFLNEDAHLDWLKHLILGTICFIAVLVAMEYFQDDKFLSFTIANFAAIFLGVGKEVYDKIKGKPSEGRDIIWTIKGGVLITLIYIIIEML